MAFTIVKFIHILAAITAVGVNVSYTVWIVRAQREPVHTAFALKGIQFLDQRIANPAYGLLLITGILMVILLPYPITTLWIDVALVLYVVIIVLAVAFYTPTLRNQIRLADGGDVNSAEFMRLASRSQTLGIALGVVVLVILGLMVFKPHL
jgi:uncharacterized membrane protein